VKGIEKHRVRTTLLSRRLKCKGKEWRAEVIVIASETKILNYADCSRAKGSKTNQTAQEERVGEGGGLERNN